MAFWNGRDLDDLLESIRSASILARDGDFLSAKPAFMESLDGIEALLSPTHAIFVNALHTFILYAIKFRDFDEAITRVHRAHQGHFDILGPRDKRTWQFLARLGHLYLESRVPSQGFHMLHNARKGLIAAISDPEDAYICTLDITKSLITIANERGDFEAVERELWSLVSKAEALGDLYRSDVVDYKHELVHFYYSCHTRERHPSMTHPARISRSRLEQMLLEIINFKRPGIGINDTDICCRDHLRSLYQETGNVSKLEDLLHSLEDFVTKTGKLDAWRPKMVTLKQGIATAFAWLGQLEKAESWFLHLLQESPKAGALDETRLMTLMNYSALRAKFKGYGEAEPYLREAQQMAKEILEPNHPFHSFVATTLASGSIQTDQVCHNCLVHPSGGAEKPLVAVLQDRSDTWVLDRASHVSAALDMDMDTSTGTNICIRRDAETDSDTDSDANTDT